MNARQILFEKVDSKTHQYTTETIDRKSVLELFDVDDEQFAFTYSHYHDSEETSAGWFGCNWTIVVCVLCSKSTLEKARDFELNGIGQHVDLLRALAWGSNARKVKSLDLPQGRVYIQDGSLICDAQA